MAISRFTSVQFISPWQTVRSPDGELWTVLPWSPPPVLWLRSQRDGREALVTFQFSDSIELVEPTEAEARELLARVLGAQEIR